MRTLSMVLVVSAAILAFSGVGLAAANVMLDVDPAISVDVPKFGLVVPSQTTWGLTMTSNDTDPDDGILFTATEASGTYYLRVFSNTDVTVTLSDGVITSGTTTFNPAYAWALGTGAGGTLTSPYTAPTSATLYVSGGAENNAQINLDAFSILVGAAPNAGTDITQFVPGAATGTLDVTVAATGP